MARFLVGFLILANAHLITAMAGDKDRYFIAEVPMAARKLIRKHDNGFKIAASYSSSSPSESPKSEDNAEHFTEASVSGVGDGASSVLKINHHHHHHHHRWIDEPDVGGVVILGGLVAAFFVTVFCYIRVTRRRNAEHPNSPTNLSILIPNKEIS